MRRAETVPRAVWVRSRQLIARECAAILIGLGLFLGCVPLQALTLDDDWRWTRYEEEHGLPSTQVSHIVQTPAGFAWARTAAGLARFDGYGWQAVDLQTSKVVTYLDAVARDEVLVLAGGRLYTGSDRLELQDIRRGDTTTIQAAAAYRGGIIVAVDDSLFRWQNGQLSPWPTPDVPLSPRHGAFLVRSKGGQLWFIGEQGLYRWGLGLWHLVLPHVQVETVAERDGLVVASVSNPFDLQGLWSWRVGTAPTRDREASRDTAIDVEVGPHGTIYSVHSSGDVRVYEDGHWRRLQHAGLRRANDLEVTPDGDLWSAGSAGIWLHRGSLDRWSWVRPEGDERRRRIHAFLRTATGELWMASAAGIEILAADGSMNQLRAIDGQPLQIVTGLALDGADRMWLVSGAGSFPGAYVRDSDGWQHVTDPQGLPARFVHGVEVDRQGRAWLLSLDPAGSVAAGAWVLTGDEFERWHEGPLGSGVYTFLEDSDGAYWFGTREGLSRWRDGKWNHWSVADGLGASGVYALAEGEAGRVWVGSRGKAASLASILSDDMRVYGRSEGFIFGDIWDLVTEPDGALWISTQEGLVRHSGNSFSHFGVLEGLDNPRLWPLLLEEGRLHVGTQGDGMATLDLLSLREQPPRIQVYHRFIDGDSARLRWTALSSWGSQAESEILSRHRVDEGDWSGWGKERDLLLKGLPYGTHRVDLQAADLLGLPGQAHPVEVTIERPLHLQPIVILSGSAAGLALLALAVATHLSSRQDQRRLRQDLAVERVQQAALQLQTDDDWGQVAHVLTHEMRDVLEANACSINLVDLEYDTLCVHDDLHETATTREQVPPALRRCVESGEIQYRRNRSEMAAHGDEVDWAGVQSIVDVPFEGGTIGMNSCRSFGFRDQHLRMLNQIAAILSQAYRQRQAHHLMTAQREQLEEKSRLELIDRLATGVAHEINNPLTHIIGYAQLLRRRELAPEVGEMIDVIQQGGERAAAIVQRLLSFSRHQGATAQSVELTALTRETIALVQFQFESEGVRIVDQSDTKCIAWAHPGHVQQMLLSLLENGREILDGLGGKIWVSVTCDLNASRITVEDSGPGVPPEVREKIFHPFYSTKNVNEGCGLGLSTCQALAIRQGGRLTLGEGGRGALFILEFPLRPNITDGNGQSAPTVETHAELGTVKKEQATHGIS